MVMDLNLSKAFDKELTLIKIDASSHWFLSITSKLDSRISLLCVFQCTN
jgi:hypothetical protein